MSVVLAAFLGALQDLPPAPTDLDVWIEALASDDIDTRDHAALQLIRRGRIAWPALERAQAGPDPALRAAAAEILEQSRRRRGIPNRILREHPAALQLLDGPATPEKIRLIRALGRNFDECEHLIVPMLRASDAETRIAAAEVLADHRRQDWVDSILELFASESCPRASRVSELLGSAVSKIPRERYRRLLDDAGPIGRARLVEFAVYNYAIEIPRPILHEMLAQPNSRSIRAALAWIRSKPRGEDSSTVLPLLDSADPDVLAETLETLRILKCWVDPSSLRRLVAHEAACVRSEAIELMYRIEHPATEECALLLLKDPSTSVRRTAFVALWNLRGPAALERTLAIYFEEDGDPRDMASAYLLRHRGWVRPRLLDELRSPALERRLRALEMLYSLDGMTVPIEAAADPHEEIRRWAVSRLLCHDGEAVAEASARLAKDPCEAIRYEVLRGLVRRGRVEFADDLAGFLDRAEYAYKHGAAESLLDAGDRSGEFARRILRIEDAVLRRMALETLAERRILHCSEEALACLSDPDPRLQRVALHYLSLVLSVHPSPHILDAVRKRLPDLETEALEPAMLLVLSEGDFERVHEILSSRRLLSSERILRALAERGDPELADLVGNDAEMNERVFRALAGRKFDAPRIEAKIRALFAHADAGIRAGAARGAADLRLEGLEPQVLAALEDPDPFVRLCAVEACSGLWIVAAGSILPAMLEDEDPDVRIETARTLSRIRPSVRSMVEQCARDEEQEWVRKRLEAVLADWK